MSLLLDALKKAADDKKKNLLTDDLEEKSFDADESLELELDLDSAIEEIPDEESFPEVDETSIPQAIIAEPDNEEVLTRASTAKEFADLPVNTISEDTTEETTKDSTPAPADISLENPAVEAKDSTETVKPEIIDSPTEAITTSDLNNDNDIIEKEDVTDHEPPSTNKQPTHEVNEHLTKNITTEQALLALINKSNKHSKQAHFKQTITIAILVVLLLIGSGLFFYIKMHTASQEIFIASDNQTPVNRAIEPMQINTRPVISKAEKTVSKVSLQQKKIVNKKSPVKNTPIKSKPIKIVHTKKHDPVSDLTLEAYNEFYRGNYAQANNIYNQVILREPNNRDALLGLSAIAIKQQRYEFARQKYQYLLHLNPKDSIAIAGMSSIKNDIDPQLNESQLRFMLKENPDAAHLYFALGSLHASQKKWPEAQSAYFSAWSTENKNADYAFNLAVSLDHLDKRNQALDFYILSLKLKQASSGNFSTETTSKRINTLKENNE